MRRFFPVKRLVKLCEICRDRRPDRDRSDASAASAQPGFIELGSSIHFLRFSGVFWIGPEAIVSRLARCVRSGPNRPVAAVPATVWQLMQALCMKTVWPSAAAGLPGNPAARASSAARPRRRTPRESAHRRAAASWHAAFRSTARTGRDRGRPACGSIHMVLTRFGITSILPARRGTQKL